MAVAAPHCMRERIRSQAEMLLTNNPKGLTSVNRFPSALSTDLGVGVESMD